MPRWPSVRNSSTDEEGTTRSLSKKRRARTSSTSSTDDVLQARRKRNLEALRKGFEIEVVYEEPSDALKPAPFRRTRPKNKGEIIADILFYGDSLTSGISTTGQHEDPWPFHLKKALANKGYNVVISSFERRTTCFDNETDRNVKDGLLLPTDFNGLFHFGPVFSSHSPQWVVIMLGTFDITNDCRRQYGGKGACTAKKVALNCAKIASKARELFEGHCHEGNLKIALVCPPKITLTATSRKMGFDEKSREIASNFHSEFERVCIDNDLLFVDCGLTGSDIATDGIHLTEESGKRLANAVWEGIQRELPRRSKKPERFDPIQM